MFDSKSNLLRTATVCTILILFLSVKTTAQQPPPPPYLGEFRIDVINPTDTLQMTLQAVGMVFGSRYDGYPLTHEYDSITKISPFLFFVDRQGYPPLTVDAMAYGEYKLTLQGYSSYVYINFQDCDYCDGNGFGGFGTHYLTADLQMKFDQSTGKFWVKNESGVFNQVNNGARIGIWDDGRKDSIDIDQPNNTDCFKVPVTLKNQFSLPSGGTVSDKYFVVDNDCINLIHSDSTINSWGLGSSHSMRSEHNKYNNLDSASGAYRHHHWNTASTDPSFNYAHVVSGPATLTSWFKPSFSGRMFLSFEGTSGIGPLNIRDPWLIKPGNDSCAYENDSTFEEYQITNQNTGLDLGDFNGFGGVHKNQSASDSTFPYYSLQFSNNKRYQLGSWIDTSVFSPIPGNAFFLGYKSTDNAKAEIGPDIKQSHQRTGYETKAVVFHEDSSTIIAKYKLHRTSDAPYSTYASVSPVSPNSQRKIDVVFSQAGNSYQQGLYQCVYESMGDVWLIESTDGCNTWSPELLVSSGNGSAKHPCISSDGTGAYITFIEADQNGQWGVILKQYASGQINYDNTPYQNHTHWDDAPVVQTDETSNTVFLVWEGDSTQTHLQYCAYFNQDPYNHGDIAISGNGGKAERPTVTHNSYAYYLAWREFSDIHMMEADFDTYGGNSVTFFADSVVNNSWQPASGSTSITMDSDFHPSIAWTAQQYAGPVQNNVYFRQFIGGTFGTIEEFSSGGVAPYWEPSVGAFASGLQQNSLRIAHSQTDGQDPYIVEQLENGNWTVPGCAPGNEGLHQNIVARAEQGYLKSVFPQPSNILSGLWQITFNDTCLSKSSGTLQSSREIDLIKDTTRMSLRLCEIKLRTGTNETMLEWNTGYDTLVVGKTKEVNDYLRTAPVDVPANSQLLYRATDFKKGIHQFSDSMRLKLELVDANTNAVISTFSQFHPKTNPQGRRDNRNTLSLAGLAGRSIYLRVSLVNRDPEIKLLAIDTYLAPGGSFPKEDVKETPEMRAVPLGYALDQNYPNPFNPETQISYALPEAASVKIIVIDIFGRIISELVNENKTAGSYSTTFNAKSSPAGIYCYRMTANGMTMTRKMALVK